MKIVYDTDTNTFTSDDTDISSLDMSDRYRHILNDRLSDIQAILEHYIEE